ncbi:hypothetical protein AAEH85_21820, partial [Shewanella algae]
GTTALVAAFERLLLKKGAQILKNSQVERIEVENSKVKRVIVRDGRSFPADIIVSNADPLRVYRDMISKEHRSINSDWKLKRMTHSMSL